MNRTEALQAAFNIAGLNVTAEEHIQYAEFLLGDQNVTYIKDRIIGEDTQSICDDPREYIPHGFIGDRVYADNGDIYPTGAVALDGDRDVWYFENGFWTCYDSIDGEKTGYGELRESYSAVFVA